MTTPETDLQVLHCEHGMLTW